MTFDTLMSLQTKRQGLKPVSANLENLQLTQVRDAVRETGYLLQQAQPIFLHSFIISHD